MASAGSGALRRIPRQVKPLLSVDKTEARRRVLNLYKAWYRQVPYIIMDYHIEKSEAQCREKLRELFLKHKDVEDIRVIDMLVIKGQMELKETAKLWKQKHGIMDFWRESVEPKPQDFMSKFLDGH